MTRTKTTQSQQAWDWLNTQAANCRAVTVADLDEACGAGATVAVRRLSHTLETTVMGQPVMVACRRSVSEEEVISMYMADYGISREEAIRRLPTYRFPRYTHSPEIGDEQPTDSVALVPTHVA